MHKQIHAHGWRVAASTHRSWGLGRGSQKFAPRTLENLGRSDGSGAVSTHSCPSLARTATVFLVRFQPHLPHHQPILFWIQPGITATERQVMLNWWELQENSSMRLGLEECKSIALGTTEQRGVPAAGRGNWAAAELEWCWKQESGLSSQEHTRFVMGAAGLDTTPALQPAQSSSPPRDFP